MTKPREEQPSPAVLRFHGPQGFAASRHRWGRPCLARENSHVVRGRERPQALRLSPSRDAGAGTTFPPNPGSCWEGGLRASEETADGAQHAPGSPTEPPGRPSLRFKAMHRACCFCDSGSKGRSESPNVLKRGRWGVVILEKGWSGRTLSRDTGHVSWDTSGWSLHEGTTKLPLP